MPQLNSKSKGGGILLVSLIVAFFATITPGGATAASHTTKPAGVIAGILVAPDGQPSTGFVKVSVEPPEAEAAAEGTQYQETLLTWQEISVDGSFSFTSSDLLANPSAAQEVKALADENGGYVNLNVTGVTPDGMSVYSAPRELTSNTLVINKSEGETANFTIKTQAETQGSQGVQSRYDDVMTGKANPAQYCSLRTITSSDYPEMRIGITHKWDGSSASFFYSHVSDSTFDAAFQAAGGGWAVSGSTHTSNSTSFSATVHQVTAARRGTYRSKYHSQTIWYWDEGAGGNPLSCGYHWGIVSWIGGLINGPHITDTLDGRCNTVPPQYSFPEGAGTVSYHAVHAENIGGSVKLGVISIGGSTGLTGSIGWHYTLKHAEWLCGASGHTSPAVAPVVAVGPRVGS